MDNIITGRVVAHLVKERIIAVMTPRARTYVQMSYRQEEAFGRYFVRDSWVALVAERIKPAWGLPLYGADHFLKISRRHGGRIENCFDQEAVRETESVIVTRPENRMFIDMEFTMPLPSESKPHEAEIIEFAAIVTDMDGRILTREKWLVSPRSSAALNRPTLKFTGLKREDFVDALPAREFAKRLEGLVERYSPRIVHWGRNDALALSAFGPLNDLPPFRFRRQLLNLMSIMKIYYHEKKDLGLFTTYEALSGSTLAPQEHDSLVDATVLLEVFRAFKASVARHETRFPRHD